MNGFLAGICLLSSPSFIAAQETAAGFVGRVTDESGAVLPGVTVTVTSPALQTASMTASTDTQGEYRVIPVPIGV